MASGPQRGGARLSNGDRHRWPVTVPNVSAMRSGGSLATPLLRNEEFVLHPLPQLRLGIGSLVDARHK